MELEMSSLPAFIAAVGKADQEAPSITGELRSSERAPLLVSCASSRIHQKQRNFNVETLLEKYAEPLSAWAWLHGAPYPAGFLAESWRLLLLNHPHDSICGCSNDQVHREIEIRYDQAEQLAALVQEESTNFLSQQIDTSWFQAETGLIVFNPHPRPAGGLVEVMLPDLGERQVKAVVDREGRAYPWQSCRRRQQRIFFHNADAAAGPGRLGWVSGRNSGSLS